jgi:hypothetical protein
MLKSATPLKLNKDKMLGSKKITKKYMLNILISLIWQSLFILHRNKPY